MVTRRLNPTALQAEKINQNIGCARFVYNQLLDGSIKVYKKQSGDEAWQ